MTKDNSDHRVRSRLDLRKRNAGKTEREPANEPLSNDPAFSSGSLWASTAFGGLVSFLLFRSAYYNVITGKLSVSTQMGLLKSIYRWPEDWGFFTTIVGLKLLAGTMVFVATLYCLKDAFRSHFR